MIKTNVEVITPAVAAEYLRLYNQGNRKPNKAQVAYYAKMMNEGEWELNGESIKFSGSGETLRLLDGQHRLMACVEANVPFETLVVRDIEEKTFDTLDQGCCVKRARYSALRTSPMLTMSHRQSTNISIWGVTRSPQWVPQIPVRPQYKVARRRYRPERRSMNTIEILRFGRVCIS